jgi:hypothetical protein
MFPDADPDPLLGERDVEKVDIMSHRTSHASFLLCNPDLAASGCCKSADTSRSLPKIRFGANFRFTLCAGSDMAAR